MNGPRFELWAHRGSHDGEIILENTLPAFLRALEEDCDGIELDVHVSRDGHVVVHHDECLSRLSADGDTRRISELTLEKLLDVPLIGDHRIPTLRRVLEVVDRARDVNIEIKDPQGVDAVLEVIQNHDRSRLLLSSFSADTIAYAAERAPELTRVWISGDETDDPTVEAVNIDPRKTLRRVSSSRWHTHRRYAAPELVAELNAANCPTYVWTVNDAHVALELSMRGVQGIFCDQPGKMRAALDALAGLTL